MLEVLEPVAGSMTLSMPRSTAVEIARSLHSIPGDIPQAVLEDVICELLNPIAGRIMKRVLPQECMFRLGLPRISSAAAAGRQAVRGDFVADNHLLTMEVML